jgi:hypothetical protein
VKRILLIGAAVIAAGGIAATPAVAGLAGNSSFSHQIPVRVPSQARAPQLVDDHHGGRGSTPVPATHTRSGEPEPGDDRGGLRSSSEPEPGDDRGGPRSTSEPEPGDDRGGQATSPEPGDDNGGQATSPEPGDDRGGRGGGGHGSDG